MNIREITLFLATTFLSNLSSLLNIFNCSYLKILSAEIMRTYRKENRSRTAVTDYTTSHIETDGVTYNVINIICPNIRNYLVQSYSWTFVEQYNNAGYTFENVIFEFA